MGDMVGSGATGEMPRGKMADAGERVRCHGKYGWFRDCRKMPRGEMNELTFGSTGEAELPLMELRGDWRLILATTSVKRSN